MPKGRANKLVPKYVGPYKITKAIPLTSNYELELLMKLVKQQIHKRFHTVQTTMHYFPIEGKHNCMILACQMKQNDMSMKLSAIIGQEGI